MTSLRSMPIVFAAATFALCSLLVAPRVSAHITGASFSATTSPYVVDVGYDPVQFIAGQSTRFDFVLSDEKTNDRIQFDQVWIRITNGDGTQLATGLFRQPFGPTTLLYVFAKAGEYKVEPSFRDADGKEIAAASFPITVSEADGKTPFSRYALFIALFAAGCGIGAGLMAFNRRG